MLLLVWNKKHTAPTHIIHSQDMTQNVANPCCPSEIFTWNVHFKYASESMLSLFHLTHSVVETQEEDPQGELT